MYKTAEAFCVGLNELQEICNNQSSCNDRIIVKLKEDVLLPSFITEILVTKLGEQGIMNDLTLNLFDYEHTRMSSLKIPNCRDVTSFGLEILKKHQVKRIELNKLNLSLNTLVKLLSPWTIENLEILKVTNSLLWDPATMCSISPQLMKLQHLRELDVSYTDFNYHNFHIIATCLKNLEALNISGTPVDFLTPLKKCSRLKRLSMADVKLHLINDEASLDQILLSLTNLEHLDISFEKSNGSFDIFMRVGPRYVFRIMNYPDQLPNLKSLDISGQEDITETSLITFLQYHPNLVFLGLMSDAAESKVFLDPTHPEYRSILKVTGTASIDQIVLAMKLYERRNTFIQRCLYALYNFSESDKLGPRSDVIELVTSQMKTYRNIFNLQVYCTACLHNLTKYGVKDEYSSDNISSALLSTVVERTLDAMEAFPAHSQLQKNALLTLCNDRILQETRMNRYRCAQLVVNAFCNFSNPSIETLCVAVSSVIAAKISSAETALIGSCPRYMNKLLDIVRRKLNEKAVDLTLGFTLSTLWNLTDECPRTCSTFLELDGLKLFTKMLQEARHSGSVLTKILGLLNNIAEVPKLRKSLMSEEIIDSIRSLLRCEMIEISYFSAGVLAHLVSDGEEIWTLENVTRDLVLSELGTAIFSWSQADKEMVAYRSFRPFIPLLQCYSTFQAQLWALWAIQHVLTAHAQRYYEMLMNERIFHILHELKYSNCTNEVVRKKSITILDQLEMFRRRKITAFCF